MSERTVTFTRAQIAAYADASGDHNPIHLDPEFARSVGLPGVIAHGMLQMGILATLAVEAAGGDPRRLRRIGCRFAGMVAPGETITFEAGLEGDRVALGARRADGEMVLSKASADLFALR